jgi:hypothetical protein
MYYRPASNIFAAAIELYCRLCPSPLPAEWWLARSSDISIHTWRLTRLWYLFSFVLARLHPAAAEGGLFNEPWWPTLLEAAVHTIKVNESAKLSSRDTMCCFPVYIALGMVEEAAKHES